jgi:hypothetical protein
MTRPGKPIPVLYGHQRTTEPLAFYGYLDSAPCHYDFHVFNTEEFRRVIESTCGREAIRKALGGNRQHSFDGSHPGCGTDRPGDDVSELRPLRATMKTIIKAVPEDVKL